jgi:phosphoribosylaminoimidazolecarboxamide formyltransferase/IMP cyclohydrolase
MPRALVSVSDKTGLVPFVKGLVGLGYEIVSTGGTRRHLEEAGVPVIDVAALTGFPEMMEGRVKTLHPLVHGAILGRPDVAGDAAAIREHGIVPFEVVVCNLYPFEQTVAKAGVTPEEVIEQIDVGGPSMVRAAAKNHAHVAVVSDPRQYEMVLQALRSGSLDIEVRRWLAANAFNLTAKYDREIATYFACAFGNAEKGQVPPEIVLDYFPVKVEAINSASSGEYRVTEWRVESRSEVESREAASDGAFPRDLSLRFRKWSDLRYGENPHQAAAFYVEPEAGGATLAAAEQLHGKELSYNNLLDLDAALGLVRDLAAEFERPAVAVLKHNNPCGCALGGSVAEALEKAWAGDPVSAFGSILGFSKPLDLAAAEALCQPNRFVEAILAPDFEPEALELLRTKPAWRANVRLMRLPGLASAAAKMLDYRRVAGGLLVQDKDEGTAPAGEWKIVTKRQPTEAEVADLRFAWLVCKHVKSNAIVFAKGGMVTGVGAGQMSRVDSMGIAARKSEGRCDGGVCASDAFFPFRDNVDLAAQAGIKAIVQPGGSKRDDESVAACDEHGIAMLFTGRRHFRH